MTYDELYRILDKKSVTKLKSLTEDLGHNGFTKLRKDDIIKLLISEENQREKLLELIGHKTKRKWYNNYWLRSLVILILGIFIKFYFFPKTVSIDDLKSLELKIDKNKKYAKEIEFLEKYKKKFLDEAMGNHYRLYGIEDGKLITREELVNENLNYDYKTSVAFDFDNRQVFVQLATNDFDFASNVHFSGGNIRDKFPIEEDKVFTFSLGNLFGYSLKYVLLREDRLEPILAIGVGKSENKNKKSNE